MRLSEIKNEEALDVVSELIDPITEICKDEETLKELRSVAKEKAPPIKLIKPLISKHKKEIVQILAILDRKDPETYEVSLLTLPKKLVELFNDQEFQSLFQ